MRKIIGLEINCMQYCELVLFSGIKHIRYCNTFYTAGSKNCNVMAFQN